MNLILNKFLSNGICRKLKIVNIRITKYPYNKILIVIQCNTPSFEERKNERRCYNLLKLFSVCNDKKIDILAMIQTCLKNDT